MHYIIWLEKKCLLQYSLCSLYKVTFRRLAFTILQDDKIKPVEMKSRAGEPLPRTVEACAHFEAVIDITKVEEKIYELHAEIKVRYFCN